MYVVLPPKPTNSKLRAHLKGALQGTESARVPGEGRWAGGQVPVAFLHGLKAELLQYHPSSQRSASTVPDATTATKDKYLGKAGIYKAKSAQPSVTVCRRPPLGWQYPSVHAQEKRNGSSTSLVQQQLPHTPCTTRTHRPGADGCQGYYLNTSTLHLKMPIYTRERAQW